MEPLNIAIENLTLDTVIGHTYDGDREATVSLTLADAIVEAAARRLVGDRDWPDVTTRVRQIRDEEIRTRVAAEIEAALSGTFTATNQYGEAVGKQTTLREEIARVAQAAVKVDNRNSYSREGTPFENVIRTEVNKALTAELTELVKHEKAKVVAAVQGKAGELIAQAVKDGLR